MLKILTEAIPSLLCISQGSDFHNQDAGAEFMNNYAAWEDKARRLALKVKITSY